VRRAAPRVLAVAGVLLAVLGTAVFVQGRARLGDHSGLEFLSPEQFARIDGAPARMWVGAAGATVGLLLLAALAGRLLRRRTAARTARPGPRPVVLVGAVGSLLVVAGIVVLLTTAPEPVVTYTGSYEPLTCAEWPACDEGTWPGWLDAAQQTGLGTAVAGALLLAGVAGWLRGSDSRADQL